MLCTKKLFKSVLLSVIISVFGIAVLAAAVYALNLSENFSAPCVWAISAVSVFAGAFILARRIEKGGLIHGLCSASLYLILLSAVSFAVNGSVDFCTSNLLRALTAVCAGTAGGVLGINAG